MNLVVLITSLIAVVFYTFVLYLILPYKTVTLQNMVKFFVAGFIPFVLMGLLVLVFPKITNPVDLPFTFIDKDMDEFIFFTFIQVAGIEELCKFIIFYLTLRHLIRKEKVSTTDNLVSYILYASVCYAGFSFIETYIRYDQSFTNQRLLFSMVNHMFTGIVLAYWYVIAKMPKKRKKTLYYIFSHKYEEITKYATIGVGFLTAIFIHGIYNFNAEENNYNLGVVLTFNFLILFVEIYFAFKMIDHIIRKENKIKQIQSGALAHLDETDIDIDEDYD